MLAENGEKVHFPKQPRALCAALEGKKKLNWQINEWAAGVAECSSRITDLREEYSWLPDWVWDAVKRSSIRIYFESRRQMT